MKLSKKKKKKADLLSFVGERLQLQDEKTPLTFLTDADGLRAQSGRCFAAGNDNQCQALNKV